MIAVIFEVEPADDQRARYFDIAARLRPLLSEVDGFISIERFQSLSDERRILSLSFWRDEAAVTAWRNLEPHRGAQAAGRSGVFRDYRLRVAEVTRDYGMTARDQAPADSAHRHGALAPDEPPKPID
ncbi:MAG: antibiotic biosynthesis monooxygenase family protein [Thalassobaculaceae bacterium]